MLQSSFCINYFLQTWRFPVRQWSSIWTLRSKFHTIIDWKVRNLKRYLLDQFAYLLTYSTGNFQRKTSHFHFTWKLVLAKIIILILELPNGNWLQQINGMQVLKNSLQHSCLFQLVSCLWKLNKLCLSQPI